jgi:uncharacterized protein YuzE
MAYRFEYDPESGAMYFRLRAGEISHTAPLGEPALGASLDLDAEGNVLGVEFLSFEEFAELVVSAGGTLELPENLGGWHVGEWRHARTPRVE